MCVRFYEMNLIYFIKEVIMDKTCKTCILNEICDHQDITCDDWTDVRYRTNLED